MQERLRGIIAIELPKESFAQVPEGLAGSVPLRSLCFLRSFASQVVH